MQIKQHKISKKENFIMKVVDFKTEKTLYGI